MWITNLNKNIISILDAKEGVILAAQNMENNLIRRTLKRINNPLYEEILTKIASKKTYFIFTRKTRKYSNRKRNRESTTTPGKNNQTQYHTKR